jgi:hypothetical protein
VAVAVTDVWQLAADGPDVTQLPVMAPLRHADGL